ncbi:hypothetical protein [Janthinobacterium sp. B9-8]|uniref:hypothetical protein n=1 Tax=Janthinobacterium sp. B9-8 TaxID=1236179 RepID=UPI00061D3957|nr:hypothetical protein [Janthinobacterium sp. B9-8]AMC34790.1 hypothetical protein VN23_09295 [Janthinobacterium sp. B9-8]
MSKALELAKIHLKTGWRSFQMDLAAQELQRLAAIEQAEAVNIGALAFAFRFVCKNHIPKDFPQPLEQSVLAATLLEALWPHLSDDGRKSHRAVVDAMVAGKSNPIPQSGVAK